MTHKKRHKELDKSFFLFFFGVRTNEKRRGQANKKVKNVATMGC
jgi:hypothetical protein